MHFIQYKELISDVLKLLKNIFLHFNVKVKNYFSFIQQ